MNWMTMILKRAKLAVCSKTGRNHALADYAMYDYPGDYRTVADGNQLARTRLDEPNSLRRHPPGESNARSGARRRTKLLGQPRADQNRECLICPPPTS